jgi:hypothetical protein
MTYTPLSKFGYTPALNLFSPTSISNLALWHDPSDTSTITSSGGLISQINDKSGNNYHSVQATGSNQPQTNVQTINSLNCVYFNTVSRFLNLNSGILNIGNASNTIFMVYKRDTSNGNTSFLTIGNSLSFGSWKLFFDIEGAFDNLRSSHNSVQSLDNFIIGTVDDTNTHSLLSKYDSVAVSHLKSVDGNTIKKTITTLVGTTGTCSVGSIGSNNTTLWKMGEVIAYSKALTNAEMNTVGNYLATKWGFTWTNL